MSGLYFSLKKVRQEIRESRIERTTQLDRPGLFAHDISIHKVFVDRSGVGMGGDK